MHKIERVEDVLAWGGIVKPSVLRQRDDGFFSVIEYAPYSKKLVADFPEEKNFCAGWAIWIEHQHTANFDNNFLVIFWRPAVVKTGAYIENTFADKISENKSLDYFCIEVEKFFDALSKVTPAKLLEYQDLTDFLSFTLSHGENYSEMPETPLDLNALLAQDNPFDFGDNDIFVNGKRVMILTLPTIPNPKIFYKYFADVPFRHVQRLLFLGEEELEEKWREYAKDWCPGRKTMLRRVERDIFSELDGYYYNGFIFQMRGDEYENFMEYAKSKLLESEVFGRFEKYNLKEVFWGSLPGLHYANVTAPFVGFSSLNDLLLHEDD